MSIRRNQLIPNRVLKVPPREEVNARERRNHARAQDAAYPGFPLMFNVFVQKMIEQFGEIIVVGKDNMTALHDVRSWEVGKSYHIPEKAVLDVRPCQSWNRE